jgi:hypothetical protein
LKHKLFHFISAFIIIVASSVIALSQTSDTAKTEVAGAQATAASGSQPRTSADENFELNIAERRINERDFAASTTVEIGEETARGLSLRVGVAVGADEINLLLRNVLGRVRFRATLTRVLERLNSRPAPGARP